MELAHAVITSPLIIWTRGTGRTIAKKEIDTLRRHGFDAVGRTCRIDGEGWIWKGSTRLNIVIAYSDNHQLDTTRFNYRHHYI